MQALNVDPKAKVYTGLVQLGAAEQQASLKVNQCRCCWLNVPAIMLTCASLQPATAATQKASTRLRSRNETVNTKAAPSKPPSAQLPVGCQKDDQRKLNAALL